MSRDVEALSAARQTFLEVLLARVPDAHVNGQDPRHPAHLNVRLPGVEADMVVANLQPQLAISTGAACASGIPEPSHVLRAIGLDADAAGECVRIGVGRSTDPAQARDAANLIAEAVAAVRAESAPLDASEAADAI